MKRFALLLFTLVALNLQAQNSSSISIFTSLPGAKFMVDNALYYGSANFNWTSGGKHTLVFVLDSVTPPQTVSNTQTSSDGGTVYTFGGWTDNAGLLTPTQSAVLTVTADPHITSIKANVSLSYKVSLIFFSGGAEADKIAATCGAPGNAPDNVFRPGIVYVGSQCYWASTSILLPANSALTLNAFPYPGFVFLGWSFNLGAPDAFLRTTTVNGPMVISPAFSPAKRVRFLSSPLGLNLLIDRTPTPTRTFPDVNGLCPQNEQQPGVPLTGFPALCFGDFDFAGGSSHTISGVSPQLDTVGKYWVFDSWSNGMGANAVYKTDNNLSTPDTLTAKFVPGAQASFVTNPVGLKLNIDGRDNWPGYNFIWAQGSSHTYSAPVTQTDSKGRQYTFKSWSNSAAAAQTVTMDQAAVDNGFRVIASFSVLSRVNVQSSPPGVVLQVDGTSCTTPCAIDRASGSSLRITAPASMPMGDGARLDFQSWSDAGASDHSFTISADTTNVTANYQAAYRLSASGDPGNGASFVFDPASPDMFYPVNTTVSVTATANPGFKFRRWIGDLTGTYPGGFITMAAPRSVTAGMDRIPFIAPAGVRNAVGDTPNSAVAPGSIITIFGESLSPVVQVGRVNPLAQAIAGVYVTVNDRLLPLLYVSPEQINAQVPSDLSDGDYTLQVHATGQADVSAKFTIARDAPGLFLQSIGTQQYALALHADGSLVTPDSPAQAGETISLLGTGFGPYTGFVVDGFFPPDPAPPTADAVSVTVGGQNPTVLWSGAAPGYTGVTITKIQIPGGMDTGMPISVMITINGANSNTATLPVK
jgi:uncharacterized protein (TIGR03437 family)